MRDLIRNHTIIVGSTYFFKDYSDFISKDIDKVEVVDYPVNFQHYQQIQLVGKDIFRWVKLPPQEMIDFELQCNCPMQIGKYLVPEFCKEINFTINDLKQLQPLIDNIGEKHTYEKVIYDSYIKNNSFTLTQKQRDKAYEIYKKTKLKEASKNGK